MSLISRFKSYLQDLSFSVNIGKEYSTLGILLCGVPEGSILGLLIFLIYMNDMAWAVDCDLLLYADDSCLIFRDKDIEKIDSTSNRNFNSVCDWFFGKQTKPSSWRTQTKSILFGRKKCKNLKSLTLGEVKYRLNSIQWSCILDVFWMKIFLGNRWQQKCLER